MVDVPKADRVLNRLWRIHSKPQSIWRHDRFDQSAPKRPRDEMGHLERFFWENRDKEIQKWHHYFEIYERHFERFRGKAPTVLEIGVQNGGSMRMWRDYFGPDARLFGIDIDPACAERAGDIATIRIGSQDDKAFLRKLLADMGGPDIVIDDGSHVSPHMRASFEVLFPAMNEDGVYLVEDTHTVYWPSYSGGYRRPGSFLEYSKSLIDDLHHWYHFKGQKNTAARDHLRSACFYDSVIVFEKRRQTPPRHSITGERTPPIAERPGSV